MPRLVRSYDLWLPITDVERKVYWFQSAVGHLSRSQPEGGKKQVVELWFYHPPTAHLKATMQFKCCVPS